MFAWLDNLVARARQRRWLHLAVVNLRIFIGFAFVPAGLKKLLAEPFTDPAKTGTFHEFLHGFLATGVFYQFVGVVQLVAATLLMTQRFATAGAALMLPVITAILVFCWSTAAYFTAAVVTLIHLGIVGLLVWDLQKWRALFAADRDARVLRVVPPEPTVDLTLWGRCGAALLLFYGAVCALGGGIYRPKRMELDNPAFWVFPIMLLFPIVTYLVDRGRARHQ